MPATVEDERDARSSAQPLEITPSIRNSTAMCLETCVERHGRQRFGHSPFPNPFPSAAPVVLSTTARVRVRVRGFPKAGSFFFSFLFWQIYFTAFRELSFLNLARTLAVCICQEAVATLCSKYSLCCCLGFYRKLFLERISQFNEPGTLIR